MTKQGYRPYGESGGALAFGYTSGTTPRPGSTITYARMFGPAEGRFRQVDPIGYRGGGNLYAYVGNDPLAKELSWKPVPPPRRHWMDM